MAALSAEVEATIMGATLEIEGEALTPIRCYKLAGERLALYGLSGAVDGLTADCDTVVAVVCTTSDGRTVETLVDSASGSQFLLEDPIMYTEVAVPSLVEAQFDEGGPWVLSRGTVEGIEGEKRTLFAKYAETIEQLPPGCLATLRRLLQAGPVTSVYSGGGNGKYVKSHEGFALRMPPAELGAWQALNDKGELVDVPRPAVALRVWDAASGAYAAVDPHLAGAPDTAEACDAWYVGVVKKLKASEYLGPATVDRLATSERTEAVEPEFVGAGSFSNRWTDLVLATQP